MTELSVSLLFQNGIGFFLIAIFQVVTWFFIVIRKCTDFSTKEPPSFFSTPSADYVTVIEVIVSKLTNYYYLCKNRLWQF